MEGLINNIVSYLNRLLIPIFVLLGAFMANAIMRYKQEKDKEEYFDEISFWKQNVVSHLLACFLALVYTCVSPYVLDNCSNIVIGIMYVIFFAVLIKIIIIQNAENGGYIVSFDGASGAIMYITSSLSPIWFFFIYLLIAIICYFLYERHDSRGWKIQGFKRGIDAVEAFVASIIVGGVKPDSFIGTVWLNTIVIVVFTLMLPFVNERIYSLFDDI